MAQTTTLNVVNACLKTMGETPLNAVDTDHPYVQAALLVLEDANKLEQEVGWWFNSDFPTLVPDPNTHFIYIPTDALNVETGEGYTQYVQRGNRLWDTYKNTFQIETPVLTRIIREIPFEDLPENVRVLVSLRTQLDFQASYDADDAKYQKIYASYGQAYNRVRRMHIRNKKTNMFDSPHASVALSRIRPMSRYPTGRLPPYGR